MDFLLKKISASEYQALIEQAQVIEKDGYGIKVYLLPDGRYLKLFRTKRLISSATLFPHALRFKRNVEKLSRLNIPTLSVESLFAIPDIKRHGVLYSPLIGDTLRQHMSKHPIDESLLFQLGEFLARLHQKGIFFRSVHFGNIILTPEKELGLIDVADMQISHFPLNYFKRLRNFKHFLRVKEDIQLLADTNIDKKAIEAGYLSYSQISNRIFIKQLKKVLKGLMGIKKNTEYKKASPPVP